MIIRCKKSKHFLHMGTSALLEPKLSFKAKGVLAYLLSKPETWKSRTKDLQNHSTDGRHAILEALKELRKLGYADVRPLRDGKTGRLQGKEMEVSDSPIDRLSDLRIIPSSDNRPLSIKEGTRKKESPAASRGRGSDDTFGLEKKALGLPDELVKEFSDFTIKNRLHQGRKGSTKNGWEPRVHQIWRAACAELLEQMEDNERFCRTMRWYFKNFRTEYVPKVHSLRVFCERFQDIEEAKRRIVKKKTGHDNGDTPEIVGRINGKPIYKEIDYRLDEDEIG